ncbi:MAG: biotin--[acetyl-CoA-carboxylase] ligase [Thioalkalivibrio sp.]
MTLLHALGDGQPQAVDHLSPLLPAEQLSNARRLLAEWGLPVHEHPTGVLRLDRPVQALSGQSIIAGLPESLRARLDVHVFARLYSTNRWLADAPRVEGDLACLAEYQDAGRGRRGRDWIMPVGAGLAMSLSRDVTDWGEVPARITLAMGLAVAQALGHPSIGLKWPNDLVANGRKLAGMLVEQRSFEGRVRLIIGLGINVAMPKAVAIDQPWVDLGGLWGDGVPGRNELAAKLIQTLVEALDRFPGESPALLQEEWSRFDVLSGRQVVVSSAGNAVRGIACGVDDMGRLRIMSRGKHQFMDAGEVSVRTAV